MTQRRGVTTDFVYFAFVRIKTKLDLRYKHAKSIKLGKYVKIMVH